MFGRHLTEVEEELARAKAILREVLPPQEFESLVESPHTQFISGSNEARSSVSRSGVGSDYPNVHPNESQTPRIPSIPPIQGSSTSIQYLLSPSAIPDRLNDYASPDKVIQTLPASSRTPVAVAHGPVPHTPGGGYSTRSTNKGPTFPLESPPATGDFEWDERTGKPEGDHFVDGMASLPSELDEGGYLGVLCHHCTLSIV
jgi:hypothetical protein